MVNDESSITYDAIDQYFTDKFLPYVRSLYDETTKTLSSVEDFFTLLLQAIIQQQINTQEVILINFNGGSSLIWQGGAYFSGRCILYVHHHFPFRVRQLDRFRVYTARKKRRRYRLRPFRLSLRGCWFSLEGCWRILGGAHVLHPPSSKSAYDLFRCTVIEIIIQLSTLSLWSRLYNIMLVQTNAQRISVLLYQPKCGMELNILNVATPTNLDNCWKF